MVLKLSNEHGFGNQATSDQKRCTARVRPLKHRKPESGDASETEDSPDRKQAAAELSAGQPAQTSERHSKSEAPEDRSR
jgi:hypothetical protein